LQFKEPAASFGALHDYWSIFCELIVAPFRNIELVWGIVPLYFGWLLNEITSKKASFHTAVQTGFGLLWAGLHWAYHWKHQSFGNPKLTLTALLAVNIAVTIMVILIGAVALISGIMRKFPPGLSFLGHSRFSNYFMITIFPIQTNDLSWSWDRLAAIGIFAVPIWLVLHFGLMPLRK
jgi:hypothetical protein